MAESAVGRQTLAKNAATSRAFQYDDLDRPISIYDSAFGTARRVYDADGRVVQAVYPDGAGMGYPEGLVTTYQYDARGAVVGISDPIGGTWQLDYDAAGRPIHETSRFGIDREIAYTSEGFVDEITLRNSAGAYLEVFDYGSYDALGNPGQIKTCEGMASCSASPTGTTTIGYDALSRVTSVSYPGSSESFGYDRAGNRRTHTVNGTLRSLDVADELTAIRQGATVLESFTYDLAGRRQTRTAGGATTTYTYDPLGRLQVLVTPATGQSNVVGYDALDTRYLAWDAQTKRTDYALGEWAEMRGSERVRLVHGPGIDAVRAEVSSTTARALQTDAGGNMVLATVGDAISETRRYGAFGTVRASSGTQTISRGFAGRPSEGTTGLVSLRARHYDPATGRFLQPDPLGIETDQLYAYAANNPYVFSDPMGLMPSSLAQWGAAGRGFAFGAGTALGTSYAIGTGLGWLGTTAIGAAAVPAATVGLTLGGIGLAAYGAYELYNGGWQGLTQAATALWNGNATLGQAFGFGSAVGGWLAESRHPLLSPPDGHPPVRRSSVILARQLSLNSGPQGERPAPKALSKDLGLVSSSQRSRRLVCARRRPSVRGPNTCSSR